MNALSQYPLKIKKLELKRHAANTVFKVTDTRNRAFQLRIQAKHHTKSATLEELVWLNHILKKTDILVPAPQASKDKKFIVEARHELVPTTRQCILFDWLPGRKRWSSINEQYAYMLGVTIAKLQKSGQGIKIKHRDYWNAEGLVGIKNPTYVRLDKLSDIHKSKQEIICQARQNVFKKLKRYETIHADKCGLIHCDLQPNNILYHQHQMNVIDFGDCGIGLYAYELATALHAFNHLCHGDKHKRYQALRGSLYDGYTSVLPLTQMDIALEPILLLTIKLATVSCLEQYKSNQKLKQFFAQAVKQTIASYQSLS